MKNSKNNLIAGVIHYHNNNYYNSAVLINSKNKVEKVYDKNFLNAFENTYLLRDICLIFSFLSNKVDFIKGKKNSKLIFCKWIYFILTNML